ncbi:MAG: hypothetical protein RLO81_11660 [Fulvivirga sp.]|uniref:hypothetical protein n=1 Tax=Fulvivirga sp. TaxID=1931237 RepID=UPI0032EE27CB
MKARILFGLNFLIVIFVILSAISFYQFKEIERARIYDESIESLQLELIRLFSMDNYFFEFEEANEMFYKSGKSSVLDARNKLIHTINEKFNLIGEEQFISANLLRGIHEEFQNYNKQHELLIGLILERGFKDEGIIGDMRKHAHQIETETTIPMKHYLMLRRHEKDFLLRLDDRYVRLFNEKMDELKKEPAHQRYLKLLDSYQQEFNTIAHNTQMIGDFGSSGKKFEFRQSQLTLEKNFQDLNTLSENKTLAMVQNGQYVFLFGVAITLLFVLMLIVFTYKSSKAAFN